MTGIYECVQFHADSNKNLFIWINWSSLQLIVVNKRGLLGLAGGMHFNECHSSFHCSLIRQIFS